MHSKTDITAPPVTAAETQAQAAMPAPGQPHKKDCPDSALISLCPDEQKKGFISAGQHAHKWGTYLSVDWVFNAAVGVAFAYWGKFTQSGQKIWSGPITKGFTATLKPFIKDPHQLQKSAGYGNMFMSIIAGGMFTLPPLLVLENEKIKAKITKSLDENVFYGKEKVESDPAFAQSYYEIEHAPKKDFVTGMTSRFVALSPLLAMVLIPTTKKLSNKVWFDHVEKASDHAARMVGFSPQSFKGVTAAGAQERWKFIHESVAMDFGLGIPYAVLHAFCYNAFAAMGGKKEPEAVTPEAHDIIPSVPAEHPTDTGKIHAKAHTPLAEAGHLTREMQRRSDVDAAPMLSA